MPLLQKATLESLCVPACGVTGKGMALFLEQCEGPSREKLA